jgi:hypothetical protein
MTSRQAPPTPKPLTEAITTIKTWQSEGQKAANKGYDYYIPEESFKRVIQILSTLEAALTQSEKQAGTRLPCGHLQADHDHWREQGFPTSCDSASQKQGQDALETMKVFECPSCYSKFAIAPDIGLQYPAKVFCPICSIFVAEIDSAESKE